MKSKITDKYQITIPKEIRKKMGLSRDDSIEWAIENEKITITPVRKTFYQFKGYLKVGKGNIDEDIRKARSIIAETNKP
jgi:AbrB family looped-hinge helix DNA binding protein